MIKQLKYTNYSIVGCKVSAVKCMAISNDIRICFVGRLTFGILNDFGVAGLQDSDARVGRAEINTNDATQRDQTLFVSFKNSIK